MSVLIVIAGVAIGLGLPVTVLWVLTRRPFRDPREYVSVEWREEQLRGRRE